MNKHTREWWKRIDLSLKNSYSVWFVITLLMFYLVGLANHFGGGVVEMFLLIPVASPLFYAKTKKYASFDGSYMERMLIALIQLQINVLLVWILALCFGHMPSNTPEKQYYNFMVIFPVQIMIFVFVKVVFFPSMKVSLSRERHIRQVYEESLKRVMK